MGKILDRIIHGGPEHQARRKLEKEAKSQAERRASNARLAAYQKGLIIGAKKRGKAEGIAKGSGQGGTLNRLGAGLDAFNKGAKQFGGDIDFGSMGSGLGSGSAFGYSFDSSKKKTGKTSSPKKKAKKNYIVVNGKKYYKG